MWHVAGCMCDMWLCGWVACGWVGGCGMWLCVCVCGLLLGAWVGLACGWMCAGVYVCLRCVRGGAHRAGHRVGVSVACSQMCSVGSAGRWVVALCPHCLPIIPDGHFGSEQYSFCVSAWEIKLQGGASLFLAPAWCWKKWGLFIEMQVFHMLAILRSSISVQMNT